MVEHCYHWELYCHSLIFSWLNLQFQNDTLKIRNQNICTSCKCVCCVHCIQNILSIHHIDCTNMNYQSVHFQVHQKLILQLYCNCKQFLHFCALKLHINSAIYNYSKISNNDVPMSYCQINLYAEIAIKMTKHDKYCDLTIFEHLTKCLLPIWETYTIVSPLRQ